MHLYVYIPVGAHSLMIVFFSHFLCKPHTLQPVELMTAEQAAAVPL